MKIVQALRTSRAKFAALAGSLVFANAAMAQAADPVTTLFASISLTTVVASVIGLGVVIIGINMAFKGVDLSKRGIKKV